jgi:hypothetical protein
MNTDIIGQLGQSLTNRLIQNKNKVLEYKNTLNHMDKTETFFRRYDTQNQKLDFSGANTNINNDNGNNKHRPKHIIIVE